MLVELFGYAICIAGLMGRRWCTVTKTGNMDDTLFHPNMPAFLSLFIHVQSNLKHLISS